MDQLPVRISRHGVFVSLAQKADMVGVFQLLKRNWIPAAIFMGKSLHRVGIVFSAMDQLFFFFPFDLLRNARGLNGKGNQDYRHCQHRGKQ